MCHCLCVCVELQKPHGRNITGHPHVMGPLRQIVCEPFYVELHDEFDVNGTL